jgi:hypothetical protein
MFYLLHQDEETQKKGMVTVAFHLGEFRLTSLNAAETAMSARFGTDAPIRFSAQHILIGEGSVGFGRAINIYLTVADSETRAKVKVHFGRNI